MKNLNLSLFKSVVVVIVCNLLTGCEDPLPVLPIYDLAKVTKCERDSITTRIAYNQNGVWEYTYYVYDSKKSQVGVQYTTGIIKCSINGLDYEIILSNTKGGVVVEELMAKRGNALEYAVQYWYDKENRLKIAHISGGEAMSVYTNYFYEGNRVIVEEGGHHHPIELSSADNLGNVCNVLDFAGASLTSKYVMNADLYFLNIYGAPITKLPQGQEVEYTEDNQKLSRVGKYRYEY